MKLSRVLTAAFRGVPTYRNDWRNRFALHVNTSATVPYLDRVAADGSFRAPWAR